MTHVPHNLKKELLYTLATVGVPKIAVLSRDIIHTPHVAPRVSHEMKMAAE